MSDIDQALIDAIMSSDAEEETGEDLQQEEPLDDIPPIPTPVEKTKPNPGIKTKNQDYKNLFTDLIEKLNEQQQKAVLSQEKHLSVEAGPGSGKTAILVARAGLLSKEFNDLSKTMLITFTRKAAKQMKERLAMFLPIEKVQIGTFHSLSFQIIKKFYGTEKKYRIWDTDDRIAALAKIYGKDNMNKVKEISKAMSSYFADIAVDEDAANLLRETLPYYRKAMKDKEDNEKIVILDLDELIKNAIEIIKKKEIRVGNLLVDEAQDMNPIQKAFVDALKPEYLFIVGDPKQSIYEFRGATSIFFKNIMENLPLYTLKINYRNAPEILEAAEAIYKRGLIPMQTAGHLHLKYLQNMEEENEIIKEICETVIKEKKTLSILSRTRLESHEISAFLTKNKIQHSVIGEYNLFKRKEIKDAVAYLDLINNPYAVESFLRILNEPKRGIGKTKKDELKKKAEEAKAQDIISLLLQEAETWKGKAKENAESFAQTITEAREIKGNVRNILEYTLNKSGYYDAIEENRKMHLQVLYNLGAQFDDINEFIAYTHMGAETSAKDANIIVSTIHAVKGLEFDSVVIVNAVNGYMPMMKKDTEQEKNLFYVAVTRAKENLYILIPLKVRTIMGEIEESELSPYVKLIIDSKKKQKEQQTTSPSQAA